MKLMRNLQKIFDAIKSSEGVELFSKLSAADILFTTKEDLFEVLLLYAPIALIMLFIYPKLTDLKKELLFFILLALTVTSSVSKAGVLVVFALLIAPAYISFSQTKYPKLLFGWIFGSICVLTSLLVSYFFDLPTGYSMIFILSFASLFGSLFLKKK